MEIIPFEPAHVALLRVQDAQAAELALQPAGTAAALGPAFTAITEDGRVLAIAGIAEMHARYGTAWALLACHKGPAMLAITRAILRVLDAAGHVRIDTMVREGFDRAQDYVRLLGFEKEAVLRHYGADGEDFGVWVRLREGND